MDEFDFYERTEDDDDFSVGWVAWLIFATGIGFIAAAIILAWFWI